MHLPALPTAHFSLALLRIFVEVEICLSVTTTTSCDDNTQNTGLPHCDPDQQSSLEYSPAAQVVSAHDDRPWRWRRSQDSSCAHSFHFQSTAEALDSLNMALRELVDAYRRKDQGM
jgi:hypothetical protein